MNYMKRENRPNRSIPKHTMRTRYISAHYMIHKSRCPPSAVYANTVNTWVEKSMPKPNFEEI